MTTRSIENGDIWAAVRGLGMYRMTRLELEAVMRAHADKDMFASQVIRQAAREVLAGGRYQK